MDDGDAKRATREYEVKRPRYVEYAEALKVLATQLLREQDIAFDSVSCRAKEPQSLLEKLRRNPHYVELEDVPDLAGIRVVTRYASDVARTCEILSYELDVVEDVVHGTASTDAFGYTSRHLIVRLAAPRGKLPEWRGFGGLSAEVQVRSILQHAWASISHGLDYKSDSEVPKEVRRQLFRVAALLETGDELFDGFRTAVHGLRVSYADDVSKDNWRSLPLNLDSLSAAIKLLPVLDAGNAAVEAGWKYSPAIDEAKEGLVEDDPNREELSRLVEVAVAAGLSTLGEVADVMVEGASDAAWLRRVADRCDELGYRPYAVPTDVALLRLVSKSALPTVIGTARDSGIVKEIVDGAVFEAPSE